MEMQQGDVYDPSDPNNVYDNDMEMAPQVLLPLNQN